MLLSAAELAALSCEAAVNANANSNKHISLRDISVPPYRTLHGSIIDGYQRFSIRKSDSTMVDSDSRSRSELPDLALCMRLRNLLDSGQDFLAVKINDSFLIRLA
jgi:hypothetical protein